jgi:hydroxymethylpyrimidine pyrophosphatase-like HAD family hydrolase
MPLYWKKKRDKITRKLLFKKLFVFDLGDSLTGGKENISKEMESMICHVLRSRADVKIAILSSRIYEQMYNQIVNQIINKIRMHDPHCSALCNLLLLPSLGSSFYKWSRSENRFGRVYSETLSLEEKAKIVKTFESAGGYHYTLCKPHGNVAEDLGSHVKFYLCGKCADSSTTSNFDPDCIKIDHLKKIMSEDLSDFYVVCDGTTTIDVGRKGTGKAYGIDKLLKYTHTFKKNTMFVGKNNPSIKSLNIDLVEVDGTNDTFEMMVFLAKELLADQQRRQKDIILKQYNSVINRR